MEDSLPSPPDAARRRAESEGRRGAPAVRSLADLSLSLLSACPGVGMVPEGGEGGGTGSCCGCCAVTSASASAV
jgi:hypothetical protein